jgi:hypothetical protein
MSRPWRHIAERSLAFVRLLGWKQKAQSVEQVETVEDEVRTASPNKIAAGTEPADDDSSQVHGVSSHGGARWSKSAAVVSGSP